MVSHQQATREGGSAADLSGPGTLPIPPPPDPGLAEASRSREEGAVAIGGKLEAFHLTLGGAHDCIESSDTKRRDDRRVRLGGKRPGPT